ncbi:hypothetical protein T8J41_00075 [Nitratireductor rhodophyticola]|uniref:hypothetical protein n=1 Tax=Nitratireductor rhodophyticola TaxID=2854036 RepID=UPI002AC92C00|nr:hypothetical protein [Nitratireductor rhodophyticola]WPZ14273.1 hypothetical protein T8J41_00075 [Nitratireductor rhodophyticola]
MQSWPVKPLLVTMLLFAAGGVRASSLLELLNEASPQPQSTVVLRQIERKSPPQTAPSQPLLSYPAPSFSQAQAAELLRLSPSMIGIGTPLPALHPEAGEITSAIPRGQHRMPQMIRGGETGTVPPRQVSAPRPSQPEAAAPKERRPQARPEPEPENTAAVEPPAPPPVGEPVGHPE